jgi:hypothetical protein
MRNRLTVHAKQSGGCIAVKTSRAWKNRLVNAWERQSYTKPSQIRIEAKMTEKRHSFNLIDSLIVIFGSATLTIFLLWASTTILRVDIFQQLPDYLKQISSFLSTILTTGAVASTLLILIKRQMDGKIDAPAYIFYIVGISFGLIAVIMLMAVILKFIMPPPPDDNKIAVWQSTSKANTDDYFINGPFFSSQSKDTVEARITDDPEFGRKITFYRGPNVLGEHKDQTIGDVSVCKFSETGRLGVMFTAWDGAGSIPEAGMIAHYERPTDQVIFDVLYDASEDQELTDVDSPEDSDQQEEFAEPTSDADALSDSPEEALEEESADFESHEAQIVQCSKSQVIWPKKIDKSSEAMFEPCSCSFDYLVAVQRLAENISKFTDQDFSFSIDELQEKNGRYEWLVAEPRIVDAAWLQKQIDVFAKMGGQKSFRIERESSINYDVLLLTYYRPVYSSYQLLFTKAKIDTDWHLIYSVSPNSKAFNVIKMRKFLNDEELSVTMCVRDCQWWGHDETAQLNVKTNTFSAAKIE